MSDTEKIIIEKALAFARSNKKKIAKELTSVDKYPSDNAPVSIFMSGSPGAGKTEFSKRVIEELEKDGRQTVVRIDPDDLRPVFEDYNGYNSSLFQPAISILVDKIHDEVLKNNQNFVFDGTLSDLAHAKENIKRSLNKDRYVEIFFVYQKPELAWQFTRKREEVEGRKIPKEAFISHFLNSQHTVNELKNGFGKKVKLNIVIKDIDNKDLIYKENIDNIDSYLPHKYTIEEVEEILNNHENI